MSNAVDKALAAARGLERGGLDFVAYVPSHSIAPIIDHFRTRSGHASTPRAFALAREEEAVGIIGAINLAGGHGAIVMQDNGFGNALTALATWAVAYHLPLPILANTRGGLGEYNSMIHTFSRAVPSLLRAFDAGVFELDRRNPVEDWEATVFEAQRHAWMTHRPVVVLMDFWEASGRGDRA